MEEEIIGRAFATLIKSHLWGMKNYWPIANHPSIFMGGRVSIKELVGHKFCGTIHWVANGFIMMSNLMQAPFFVIFGA